MHNSSIIKNITLGLLLTVAFFACDMSNRKKVDKTGYQEELKDREVKVVDEAEIFNKASEIGKEIAVSSQKALASQLKKAIKEGGPVHAVGFCNTRVNPIMDSLEQQYDAEIKRVSMHYRNPEDQPDGTEKKILEAYQYSLDSGYSLSDNVQKVGSQFILYTKPIVIDNPLCLNCHGEPGKEITQATMQKIDSLYADDKAKNHKFGDLRGMWSITLSKKEIIKAL
ncbi:MAG TPA: hypothetical protein DDY13_00130 [Cytophagales bacterium]|jgi:hypothetical protein|nr:hypothetical protein [Cytophagales bacterium]